jgi:hypothetical protein
MVKQSSKILLIPIIIVLAASSVVARVACSEISCKTKCSHSITARESGDKNIASHIFITKVCCCCGKQSLCISQSPVNAYIINVSIINNIKYGHSIKKLQFLNDYTYLSPVIQGCMDHNRFSRLNIKTRPLYLLHGTLIC